MYEQIIHVLEKQVPELPYTLSNVGGCQVGVAMRQPGALPVWLIAEAIHHRRSGVNDRPTYFASQTTTFAKTRNRKVFAKQLPNTVSYSPHPKTSFQTTNQGNNNN
ncbi:hypothetical protein [Sporosarcina ureae]|uniref:hypothetical protein n=1 Tax=Sporosarcina ureae TaxID=1571 RepID=UPI0026EC231A|nr:hypothetical protein [Sporosarcina ureae]